MNPRFYLTYPHKDKMRYCMSKCFASYDENDGLKGIKKNVGIIPQLNDGYFLADVWIHFFLSILVTPTCNNENKAGAE
jgi:hypothetical protein